MDKFTLYLDAEYNGYQGQLISLALVGFNRQFYVALYMHEDPDRWVYQHVLPVVEIPPSTLVSARLALERFLSQFGAVEIVVDWPEDIAYFCNFITSGPGERIKTPKLYFRVTQGLADTKDISLIPHNALEDAKALMKAEINGLKKNSENIPQIDS